MKKGFSLPLWVAASAKSAVKNLLGLPFDDYELLQIPDENRKVKLKVHSAALINNNSCALGIAFANSNLTLDLTQNLEIWTIASFIDIENKNYTNKKNIVLKAGYGVGINAKTSEICISKFALKLLEENLFEIIPPGFNLQLEIIFPNGKFLAERTSNKSYGIVDGLSIIGTTAETHLSASPEQLKYAKDELDELVSTNFKGMITFVIGENGFDLAKQIIDSNSIIKVGNWIGPLLVHAASKNVKQILLFGYHGKLIKLAGGIFHTHNHLADARIEILVYLAIKEKIPIQIINKIYLCETIDDAFNIVEKIDLKIANQLLNKVSNTIELRAMSYINRYIISDLKIGALLFDRSRKIRSIGINGKSMSLKTDPFKC